MWYRDAGKSLDCRSRVLLAYDFIRFQEEHEDTSVMGSCKMCDISVLYVDVCSLPVSERCATAFELTQLTLQNGNSGKCGRHLNLPVLVRQEHDKSLRVRIDIILDRLARPLCD